MMVRIRRRKEGNQRILLFQHQSPRPDLLDPGLIPTELHQGVMLMMESCQRALQEAESTVMHARTDTKYG